jgi:hypothetical protein
MCGLYAHADAASIVVKDGSAFVGGVMRCNRGHWCPWCSVVIGLARAKELAEAISVHHEAGGGVYLASFTVRHSVHDGLAEQLEMLGNARRRMMDGRPWRTFASTIGLVGSVRALEITHGASGWHGHYHVLLFTEAVLPPLELARVMVTIPVLWSEAVGRISPSHAPAPRHGVGVDIRQVDVGDHEAAAAYLTVDPAMGAAMEVSAPSAKASRAQAGGRGPFDIGRDAARGDRRSLALWAEYVQAVRGRARLRWTKGLRMRLGLGREVTDEEAADEEADTEHVLTLTAEETALVLNVREVVPGLLETVEHARAGGADAAAARRAYLADLLALLDWRGRSQLRRWAEGRTGMSRRQVEGAVERRGRAVFSTLGFSNTAR